MTYHCYTVSRKENFASASMLRSVSLDSVLRAVFIVVPESRASFISPHPCATHSGFYLSKCALCTCCDVHVFLSIFHATTLHILEGSLCPLTL
jgi:hypothetical protein